MLPYYALLKAITCLTFDGLASHPEFRPPANAGVYKLLKLLYSAIIVRPVRFSPE